MKYSRSVRNFFSATLAFIFGALPLLASAQWTLGRMQMAQSGLPGDSIINIAGRVMNWLLALVGIIGIISFVIAGILYLTAGGSEDQVEKAKTALTYAIIGVIVALVGLVIVNAIDALLGYGFFVFF